MCTWSHSYYMVLRYIYMKYLIIHLILISICSLVSHSSLLLSIIVYPLIIIIIFITKNMRGMTPSAEHILAKAFNFI